MLSHHSTQLSCVVDVEKEGDLFLWKSLRLCSDTGDKYFLLPQVARVALAANCHT